MNVIDMIMHATGQNKEQIVKELVATGTINEQDAHRMVMGGDTAGLVKYAMGHRARVMNDKGLMKQARYMGAPIPENF